MPCDSSPFEARDCILPLGNEQTEVPMYQVHTSAVRSRSDIEASPFDGAWNLAWAGGQLQEALESHIPLGVEQCNVGINNFTIAWLSSDAIYFRRRLDDQVKADCEAIVKESSLSCTGEAFVVMKPFPYQDALHRAPVDAYLVSSFPDDTMQQRSPAEYLVWYPRTQNVSRCDQDQIDMNGLCVWTRDTGSWRTPSVESYRDPAFQLGPLTLRCRGSIINIADGVAMLGLEMSTLLYMSVGALTVFMFLQVWWEVQHFNDLNKLLANFDAFDGSVHERQAQFTYELKRLRTETLAANYRHPELELDLFPVLPEAAPSASSCEQSSDLSWWLVTRLAQILEVIWTFEARKPIIAFALFTLFCALLISLGQVVTPRGLHITLIVFIVIDGTFFGVLLLGIVVVGSRINYLMDEGITMAEAMAADAGSDEQQIVLDYCRQNRYYLSLFAIPFRMPIQDIVAMPRFGNWRSGYRRVPGSEPSMGADGYDASHSDLD
jgi:hypothetical protein